MHDKMYSDTGQIMKNWLLLWMTDAWSESMFNSHVANHDRTIRLIQPRHHPSWYHIITSTITMLTPGTAVARELMDHWYWSMWNLQPDQHHTIKRQCNPTGQVTWLHRIRACFFQWLRDRIYSVGAAGTWCAGSSHVSTISGNRVCIAVIRPLSWRWRWIALVRLWLSPIIIEEVLPPMSLEQRLAEE